jgi:UDP-3-O-[3-hydroxymyristoyl] glucosamine N-acyltransferase
MPAGICFDFFMTEKRRKTITLGSLAELMAGSLIGDAATEITGVASITEAQPGEITFLSGAKNFSQHLDNLKRSRAAAVIAPEEAPELQLPSIRLKNAYFGLVKALEFFHPENRPEYGIHPTAFVSENAAVGENVVVGPNAVVEAGAKIAEGAWIDAQAYIGTETSIGKNTRIFSGARILQGCQIGEGCIVHANAVIGSDGFGFTPHQGQQLKVPQIGNVIVEDNVEIGACVTIDRATMGSTRIGAGTKIDNMVHIAHNVIVGKNCTIVAQVGISGSTILEDNVTMAGQTGTVGHVTIGKGTIVAARGVVTNDVEPNSFVSGFPCKPHQEERRILAALRKLPETLKKVRELDKLVSKKEE